MQQTDLALQEERSYYAVKSNTLIQDTRYDLPLLEYKVLTRILQKIKPDMKTLEPITFDIREFCMLCGIDPNSGANYENIRKAVLNLKGRSVWIPKLDDDMQPVLDKKGIPIEETFSWVSKAEMLRGEGKIVVHLDTALEKHLYNLSTLYTKLAGITVYPLTSKYSARLYELLRSYSNMGRVYFSFEDLQEKTTNRYPNWGPYHQKVIKPAVEEINKMSELKIRYEVRKSGRRVEGLLFYITQKTDLDAEIVARNNQNSLTRECG